ncbi:MAG: hypothetical protein AAFV33_11115 [Chloroflexota bacterium]
MISQIIRYLLPPRRLSSPPKHISAEYMRGDFTTEQQLVMMAGLARDPERAAALYAELEAEHGEDVLDYIRLQIKRNRSSTIQERFLMMVRRILGEAEPRKYERTRARDPIVKTDYRHKE